MGFPKAYIVFFFVLILTLGVFLGYSIQTSKGKSPLIQNSVLYADYINLDKRFSVKYPPFLKILKTDPGVISFLDKSGKQLISIYSFSNDEASDSYLNFSGRFLKSVSNIKIGETGEDLGIASYKRLPNQIIDKSIAVVLGETTEKGQVLYATVEKKDFTYIIVSYPHTSSSEYLDIFLKNIKFLSEKEEYKTPNTSVSEENGVKMVISPISVPVGGEINVLISGDINKNAIEKGKFELFDRFGNNISFENVTFERCLDTSCLINLAIPQKTTVGENFVGFSYGKNILKGSLVLRQF